MPFPAVQFSPINPALAIARNPLVASPATPLRTVLEQMQADSSHQFSEASQPCSPEGLHLPMHWASQNSCVIVIEQGQVVGILTQRDILRLCYGQPPEFLQALGQDPNSVPVGQVMFGPVMTLAEAALTDLLVVVNLFRQHQVSHLPIVDDHQRLTGLVTCETVQHALLLNQLSWAEHQRSILANVEQRYANLLEAAPVGIFHTDAQGRYTYVNERWCEITGLQPEAALHRSWLSILHEQDVAPVMESMAAAYRQWQPLRCEFRLKCQGGDIAWMYGQLVAERSAQGHITGYLGTLTDITEHKQFEAALQKSDAQNRNILSLIPDYLFRIDQQGKYREVVTYRDDISLVQSGINPVERTMADMLPPQVAQWQMNYLRTALATGKLGIYEQRVDLGDHMRWEEVRVIKSGDDEALFMVRDISDRKHTEQALQSLVESTATVTGEDFFPSLVSHVAAALKVDYALVAELHGQELQSLAFWVNGSQGPTYRYPVPGTPCEQSLRGGGFYCEAGLQQQFPEDTDLAAMGVDCYLGVKLQNRVGDPIGILCVMHHAPLANPEQAKQLLRVLAARAGAELERQWATESLQNLNQQLETKVLERTEALQKTNAELARATRLKDEFLANMSHELRTPLNAILGLTEALQEGVFGELNDTQNKTLTTIETSGQHLLALINDILDVAKIEAGKMELQTEILDLADLCQSSCQFVSQEALKKQIQLDIRVNPDLPAVKVDPRRMRQVMINLLSNAVKFTAPGGKVTLSASYCPTDPRGLKLHGASEPRVHITVADTGIGIAPEKLKHLFQPFVQIDSALNRHYNGTGLGLALVKRIVELHGGQVLVFSQPGRGSQFTLQLPCLLGRRSASAQARNTPQGGRHPARPATPASILIAEDNEANMATISGYLKARSYATLQAPNGEQALALALQEKPDLILMDIQMPGMDGLETIRRIRQTPEIASIPVVAITALAQPQDREHCLQAGANRYLPKPLKLKQLAITIQELLSPSGSAGKDCARVEGSTASLRPSCG
jgi:PAS domain S-box-containing protein